MDGCIRAHAYMDGCMYHTLRFESGGDAILYDGRRANGGGGMVQGKQILHQGWAVDPDPQQVNEPMAGLPRRVEPVTSKDPAPVVLPPKPRSKPE